MAGKLIDMAANGRLVIPQETRKSLGLHDAGQLQVSVEHGSIVLTPVAVVPVDHGFPITDDLVRSAARAAADAGPGLGRAALRQRLSSGDDSAPRA